MNLDSKLFEGKTFVVTGHTGFKGIWLTLMLEQLGAKVIGVSDTFRPSSLYARIRQKIEFQEYFADICLQEELNSIFDAEKPNGIFHLAAQPLVLDSYVNPHETFETNIIGSVNVILAGYRLPHLEFIVAITTDKVYRNNDLGIAFNENDPLGGHDPYSASKAAAEIVIGALRDLPNQENHFPIVTTRAGNVIGGGDDSRNRLLPDVLRTLAEDSQLLLRNPNSTRPWQHVLDPLMGYLQISERLMRGEKIATSYNLGPANNMTMTVKEVAELAIKAWGPSSTSVRYDERNDNVFKESKLLSLDSTLAKKDLNWETKLTPVDAIRLTVQWEKIALTNPDQILSMTISQIKDFMFS